MDKFDRQEVERCHDDDYGYRLCRVCGLPTNECVCTQDEVADPPMDELQAALLGVYEAGKAAIKAKP